MPYLLIFCTLAFCRGSQFCKFPISSYYEPFGDSGFLWKNMLEGMSGANGCSCMGYNFDSDQDLKIEYAYNGFVFYVQGKYER